MNELYSYHVARHAQAVCHAVVKYGRNFIVRQELEDE